MFESRKAVSAVGRRFFTGSFVVLAALLTMGMGEKYTKEGNALGKRMYEVLLRQGYCADLKDCHAKETLFGEYGDRVYLHLYGVTDRRLLSIMFSMVLNEGPEITGGVPITIKVYPRQKNEYQGFRSFPREPTITMEINQ